MRLIGQDAVGALPPSLSFSGKVALVTGANAGLGFATSLHLLQRGVSHLILGVRSRSKGDAAKAALLSHCQLNPLVTDSEPQPKISIYELDLASETSVVRFADAIKRDVPKLDVAIYNAGGFYFYWKAAAETQREMTMQVDYASTALLGLLLLPLLRSSATPGSPSYCTFVGSEVSTLATIAVPVTNTPRAGGILQSLSGEAKYDGSAQYNRAKLLLAMFVASLAQRVDPGVVVVNHVCPGAVGGTEFARDAPRLVRMLVLPVFLAVKGARTPEVGARLIVRAASGSSGEERHGRLLVNDRSMSVPFMETEEGKVVQKMLWEETVDVANALVPGCALFEE